MRNYRYRNKVWQAKKKEREREKKTERYLGGTEKMNRMKRNQYSSHRTIKRDSALQIYTVTHKMIKCLRNPLLSPLKPERERE
jgi:hypothetical protein